MWYRSVIRTLILPVMILSVAISCFGAESHSKDVDAQMFTEPDPSVIAAIIEKVYSPSSVENLMTHDPNICPDSYRVDTSVYFLEYDPSDTFLAELQSMATGDLKASMFAEYPTIYIPIFGTTNGCERIVGHARLRYDYVEGKYTQRTVMMNVRSDAFLAGENVHFLERIDAFQGFRSVSTILGEKVTHGLLVRMPYTSSDLGEKVFLAKTDGQWYVYDYSNSAHLAKGSERAVLTLSEYSALRSAYEKGLSTDKVPVEDLVFGGTPAGGMSASGVSDNSSQQDSGTSTWLLTGGILVLAVTVGSAVLIKMSRRKTPAA